MTTDSHLLPKVLIIDLSIGYGGSTSRVLSLLKHSPLGRIGLASLEGAAITNQARRLGLQPYIVGKTKVDPAIPFRLSKLVRSRGFEVLDTQNIQSKFWGSMAASLTGTALVSTIHSWYLEEHGPDTLKGRLYSWLESFTNGNLDLTITVSERDRASLLASQMPGEKIALIHNAVDIDPSTVEAGPDWLRDKFSLPQDAIVCTAVGRLVAAKDYPTLLTVVKEARIEAPGLVCLILGEGELRLILENQISALRLEAHVRLPGYVDRQEVLRILRSSDLFVMTSRYEGTPIALLEAAALGLPILATRTGGIPELVRDQEHALLFDPGDRAGMAAGLVKLACNRNYASSLGERAHRHVMQTFTADRQCADTWAAYQKAQDAHRRQPRRG